MQKVNPKKSSKNGESEKLPQKLYCGPHGVYTSKEIGLKIESKYQK